MSLFKGSNPASRAAIALLDTGSASFTALIAFLVLVERTCKAVNLIEAFERSKAGR